MPLNELAAAFSLLLALLALVMVPILDLHADAKPGKQRRWMYVVSAALVRAALADVAVLAALHLALFAVLMVPLALRVTQRQRRI